MTDDLDGLLDGLGLSEAAELLRPHWAESMACLPAETPRFLCPERIVEYTRYGDLPAEAERELLEEAARVREDPRLVRLAWHCSRLLYEHLDYDAASIRQWPAVDPARPERTGLFYLLITLDMVPRTQAEHRKRGVPDAITRANCTNMDVHVARYRLATGHWGTQRRLLPWLRNHTTGVLYRLGRFQYVVSPMRGQFQAYRHRETNAVVALSNAGVEYTHEGWMLRARPGEEAPTWRAALAETDDAVTGCPISPRGHALREPVTLAKRDWRLVLATGDPVLGMHVLAGGGMTLERSIESLRMAADFFPRYFPESPFKAMSCTSWVFGPRLQTLLPAEANIPLLHRELYLYPIPSGRRDGLYFIFGVEDVDPATAPRDTSLRRMLLDELEADRPLMVGGMFILTEDLDRFGTQFYRRSFPVEDS